MMGNFCRVLIFVVDVPVTKISIHENYSNTYVNEHSQAGGMVKTSWKQGSSCVRSRVMRCLFIDVIVQLMAPLTL